MVGLCKALDILEGARWEIGQLANEESKALRKKMNTYNKLRKLTDETKFQLKIIKKKNNEFLKSKETAALAKMIEIQLAELYKLYEIE